jgi:hypothetical protein
MESFCRQTIPIIPRKWPRFRIAALVLAAAASMSLTHSPRAFGEPSDQALGEDFFAGVFDEIVGNRI